QGDYENESWAGSTAGPSDPGLSRSRYNGNIGSWRQLSRDLSDGLLYEASGAYIRKAYDYDILNRILSSRLSVAGSLESPYVPGWGGATAYRYDPNGNLRDLWRNEKSGGPSLSGLLEDAPPSSPPMDALEYYYDRDGEGRLLSNRLLA